MTFSVPTKEQVLSSSREAVRACLHVLSLTSIAMATSLFP